MTNKDKFHPAIEEIGKINKAKLEKQFDEKFLELKTATGKEINKILDELKELNISLDSE